MILICPLAKSGKGAKEELDSSIEGPHLWTSGLVLTGVRSSGHEGSDVTKAWGSGTADFQLSRRRAE
jgi:hypothetical protein